MSESDWTEADWEGYFSGIDLNRELVLGERLKWGWNHQTGEAEVWEVAGPGDGLPSHKEHLAEASGRELSLQAGDVVGYAGLTGQSAQDQPRRIYVEAYFRREVPRRVLDELRRAYPDAEITVASP